jgi:hypothetical protein
VKELTMGEACSAHERRGIQTVFWKQSQKETEQQDDLDINVRIILKWIVD